MRLSIIRKILIKIIELVLLFIRFVEKVTNDAILEKAKLTFAYTGSTLFVILLIFISTNSQTPLFFEQLFVNSKDSKIYSRVATEAVVYYPVLDKEISMPYTTATSALVIEKNKSKVLFELNADRQVPPASTAKLMTALVARDLYDLDEILTVPYACTEVEGTKAWLYAESEYTVSELMHSLLISSAADSACVLANGKINYYDFIDLMNKKALEIGMNNTKFSNPIGLDGENGQAHYSTANDLYKLAAAATADGFISEIVATKNYVTRSVDGIYSLSIKNTNKLLWEIPNSAGIKTGTTEGAGEVLIYEYAKDGKDIVIIVLGSLDRFYDTRALLSWTLRSYEWGY